MPLLRKRTDVLQSILTWFGKSFPKVVDKNVQTQIGVHFEEVSEMLACFNSLDHETEVALKTVTYGMKRMGDFAKEKGRLNLRSTQYEPLLDALCDQIVTALGVAHMLKYDIIGALEEVDMSNWSKFVDGEPMFDVNSKIIKGPAYVKPQLAKFLTQ